MFSDKKNDKNAKIEKNFVENKTENALLFKL